MKEDMMVVMWRRDWVYSMSLHREGLNEDQ